MATKKQKNVIKAVVVSTILVKLISVMVTLFIAGMTHLSWDIPAGAGSRDVAIPGEAKWVFGILAAISLINFIVLHVLALGMDEKMKEIKAVINGGFVLSIVALVGAFWASIFLAIAALLYMAILALEATDAVVRSPDNN